MSVTDADCQSCGACCGTTRPQDAATRSARALLGVPNLNHWARCTDDDVKRMPRRVRLKLLPMRDEDGAKFLATAQAANGYCTFLRGTVGEKVKCGIYDVRPTLCRRFEVGSEFCLASRREIGLLA